MSLREKKKPRAGPRGFGSWWITHRDLVGAQEVLVFLGDPKVSVVFRRNWCVLFPGQVGSWLPETGIKMGELANVLCQALLRSGCPRP